MTAVCLFAQSDGYHDAPNSESPGSQSHSHLRKGRFLATSLRPQPVHESNRQRDQRTEHAHENQVRAGVYADEIRLVEPLRAEARHASRERSEQRKGTHHRSENRSDTHPGHCMPLAKGEVGLRSGGSKRRL